MSHDKPAPFRHLLYGIAVTVILIVAKGFFEKSDFGHQLEQGTYNLLQLRLVSERTPQELPVAVVDIESLMPTPVQRPGGGVLVTPREPLLAIIQSVARQRPRAIGVDIDFSPDTDGFLSPEDPAVLDALLQLRKQGLPVFVGIFDSIIEGPSRWLGEPRFGDLAAYITVPKPEHTEPSSRMVEWVKPAGAAVACPSLASALAQAEPPPLIPAVRWMLEREAVRKEPEFSSSEILVDFSPLDALASQRVIAASAADVDRLPSALTGKIVLIGRATPGQSADQFSIPGRGMPVPGVYLHACATLTLLQAPLYRLTHSGRIVADLLAAALVFGPIFLIELFFSRPPRSRTVPHWLHVLLTVSVILVILTIGHLLVSELRLIWTDYLMVIGALLLHGPVQRVFERVGRSSDAPTSTSAVPKTAAGRPTKRRRRR